MENPSSPPPSLMYVESANTLGIFGVGYEGSSWTVIGWVTMKDMDPQISASPKMYRLNQEKLVWDSVSPGLVAAREIKYCCQGFGREVEDNSSIGRIAQHMRAAPGPGVVSSPTLSRYVTKRELRVT